MLLGSVGEPINPDTWYWYHRVVGQGRCPIIDTWWQTETGGFMITPTPVVPLKPGSVTIPFAGIQAEVVREDGMPCEAYEDGLLVIKRPWPGMARAIWGNQGHEVGPIAVPVTVEFVDNLPRTRSGKIMHRLLKAQGLGDTSILDD